MRRDEGFTLVELLATFVVISILLTLGAYSLRRYWQVRALRGAADEIHSELRTEQQEASTATHPWVYGAWFQPGTARWGLVRANATTGACQVLSRRTLGTGVTVSAAAFDDVITNGMTSKCVTATESGSRSSAM